MSICIVLINKLISGEKTPKIKFKQMVKDMIKSDLENLNPDLIHRIK